MKNSSKYLTLGIGAVLLVVIFTGSFLVDVGINSNFFIKKDFNSAFGFLLSGDCVSFNNYLYSGGDENYCKKVLEYKDAKLKSFTILNLSHALGSDEAFLNIQLKYITNGIEKTDIIHQQMRKVGYSWKITIKKIT